VNGCDEFGELQIATRRWNRNVPEVEVEIESRVFDPIWLIDFEGNGDQAAPKCGEEMDPALDERSDRIEAPPLWGVRRIKDDNAGHMAELRPGFHIQKARIEPI
jgi:hypothetical protein